MSHLGKDAPKEGLQAGLLQSGIELDEAHVLAERLEQDLDEDAAAGGCVVLGQADVAQYTPGDAVRVQQVLQDIIKGRVDTWSQP